MKNDINGLIILVEYIVINIVNMEVLYEKKDFTIDNNYTSGYDSFFY